MYGRALLVIAIVLLLGFFVRIKEGKADNIAQYSLVIQSQLKTDIL